MTTVLHRLKTTVDAIFLYQFVVYLLIWIWGVYTLRTEGIHQWAVVYVVAPVVVGIGYAINTRKSTLLCAAGDLAMAYSVARYTGYLFDEHGYKLEVVLAGSLALCMLVRFIRDLMLVVIFHKARPE